MSVDVAVKARNIWFFIENEALKAEHKESRKLLKTLDFLELTAFLD